MVIKMKVLFVVPNNYKNVGGIYLPVNNYIEQLRNRGVVCSLFLMPYNQKEAATLYKDFENMLENNSISAVLVYGLNQAYIIKKWLKELNYKGKKIALLIDCLVLEMSSVIESTTFGKDQMMFRLKRALYYFKEKECLNFYDESVFVSNVDKSFVEKKYKVTSDKVHYIPNGSKIPLIIKQKVFDGKLKIGCLTGFSDETIKNNLLPLVNDIFPSILNKNPNLELIIAGRGCTNDFENYLNSQKNIKYIGFVKDLCDFYDLVDVVFTTVKKKSGILNRVLEAWAYAKPVIGYSHNFSTFSEAINGIHYIAANSKDEFNEAIDKIMGNPQLLYKIGNNGHSLILNNYTWDSCGEKLYSIIKK